MAAHLQPRTKNNLSIRLTVPAQDSTENPNVETNPAKLQQWAEQLPFANPSSMAEALLASISHLNRFPGIVPKRNELMACYQPPFANLYQLARKASNKKGCQTTEQRRTNISVLTVKITTELAYGYKLVINEILKGNAKSINKRLLGGAIYSAMKAITLELMLEYSEFVPDSKTAWRELYQLYNLAEQYDLKHDLAEQKTSVDLLFKQILLITLTDPYRLQPGEAWSCYEYLTHWAIKADLQQRTVAPKNITGIFLLDLRSMQPPKPPSPSQLLQPEQHRIFNIIPLNLIVHRHMQQVQEEGSSAPKGTGNLPLNEIRQMFRHMLLAWHVRPTRLSERQEKYGSHFATYGLSAIHHFLLSGKFTQNAREASLNSASEDTIQTLEERHSFRRENIHYEVHRWRIFNQSTGGIGLIISPPFPKKLQVGQLILIEIDTEKQDKCLMPGIIRRIIERDPNTLEAGVQFIQGRVSPISIRPYLTDANIAGDFQHALALNPGDKKPRTLLAPHGMYKQQRKFVLNYSGKTYQIQADKLRESTPTFDRFEYHEITACPN